MSQATARIRRRTSGIANDSQDEWISLRQAAGILKIHPSSFYKVLAATPLRTLRIPGMDPLSHRDDVQRVYDEAHVTVVPTPRTRNRSGGA